MTQHEIEALAGITGKFIDYCLDNPNGNGLATAVTLVRPGQAG